MPALSKHYALLDFDPGNPASTLVAPISVDVTVSETWSPSIEATVVIPTDMLPAGLDPRQATFIGLRLQQDFGDLIYNYELTADYSGDVSNITAAFGGDVSDITRAYSKPWNIFEAALPISTVTAAYGGDVSNLTAADLMEIWRMSDFLHSSGTFNPAPSTVFNSNLMLRTLTKDYMTGQATLELTSHEAILQDSIGFPSDLIFTYTSLRAIINTVLQTTISSTTTLQPGTADYTYSPAYGFNWRPNQTGWDILDDLVKAAKLVLYCDEQGKWYLVDPAATAGDLYLKDDDNITMLTSKIDRNNPQFFDYALVEYNPLTNIPSYDWYGVTGSTISKDAYFYRENLANPGNGAAQALATRAVTRGEIYTVEAISNYDARPRQTMTIDVTGEPVKTAIIQSISFSLPSARMSLDIRDLQEV